MKPHLSPTLAYNLASVSERWEDEKMLTPCPSWDDLGAEETGPVFLAASSLE